MMEEGEGEQPHFVALVWVRISGFVRVEEGEGRKRRMALKIDIIAK